MAGCIFVTFYLTMAAAGYVIEIVFGALGIIPTDRSIAKISEGISFNYTTVLNIVFLALTALPVWRFLRTGGPAMLRMMNKPMSDMAGMQHDHAAMVDMDHGAHTGHH